MLIFLRKPTESQLESIVATLGDASFTYPDVGATRGTPPSRWFNDLHRLAIGSGEADYLAARDALLQWEMISFGWVEPLVSNASHVTGALSGTLIRTLGLWWPCPCRVVYAGDVEGERGRRRYEVAYGTVTGHPESGEERFSVEIADDGSVWYEISAFSRPGWLPTWFGVPIVRLLQARFRRDSSNRMIELVEATRVARGGDSVSGDGDHEA